MKRLFLFSVLILFVSLNLLARKTQVYKLKLVSVELNNAEGGVINNKSNHLNLINPQYSDSLINVEWCLHPTHIAMDLMNDSDVNFRIIWDEVTYIGQNNISQRMLHTGRTIIDKDDEQLPSILIKNSRIKDCFVPVDNIKWHATPISGRWAYDYLFQNETVDNIRVLFPIEIDSKRYEYIFNFNVAMDARKLQTVVTKSSLKIFKDM